MRIKTTKSTWFKDESHRLDCMPYMSGAMETREILNTNSLPKNFLSEVTLLGKNGLINPGRIKRIWVEGTKYGKKFLSSTDIRKADLSGERFISFRAIEENKKLLIKKDWTLITRAGSIGNMAYSREDMDGLACTEDVLRVIPDPDKIFPGYLYSYLRSKYGLPLIVSSTYGAIIQHIEPHHLENLLVPRLSKNLEREAHELIATASSKRTEAKNILDGLTKSLDEMITKDVFKTTHESSFSTGVAIFPQAGRRLDAFHHVGYVKEGTDKLKSNYVLADEIGDVLRPPLMKRKRVTEGGIEFLGGGDLHLLEQNGSARISLRTKSLDSYVIQKGMVLFQCVGQRYGIFGRPILANSRLIGKAVTEAVMRITPYEKKDAGYISIYLASEVGRRNTLAWSAGTSIPVLQEVGAKKIKIFWPEEKIRRKYSLEAERAWELRCEATNLDEAAIKLVEESIEAAAPKH